MTPNVPPDFDDEFAFFEAAAENEVTYKFYRDWIASTIASKEIETVIVREVIANPDRAQLLETAMQPYDQAFQKYRMRDQAVPVEYPFSRYYAWWARQYATAFLKDCRN